MDLINGVHFVDIKNLFIFLLCLCSHNIIPIKFKFSGQLSLHSDKGLRAKFIVQKTSKTQVMTNVWICKQLQNRKWLVKNFRTNSLQNIPIFG